MPFESVPEQISREKSQRPLVFLEIVPGLSSGGTAVRSGRARDCCRVGLETVEGPGGGQRWTRHSSVEGRLEITHTYRRVEARIEGF